MGQDSATTMEDILEIVTFLKDNGVTQSELDRRLNEVRAEITAAKSEIMTHVDSFIVLHQKLDTELTALQSKYERLEGYIQKLAKHLQLSLQ
ncbi:hypothetical protein HY624_02515 [Candidatus Uhrbacteria bacterium]|nr:hypothetical protein [Candidatus Uhrbacteria bacterium]